MMWIEFEKPATTKRVSQLYVWDLRTAEDKVCGRAMMKLAKAFGITIKIRRKRVHP